MADRKTTMATGSEELDRREAERRDEKLEEGLEPERNPGPRQNEGISSAGQLYASPEEAEEANPSQGRSRDDVDVEAQHGRLRAGDERSGGDR